MSIKQIVNGIKGKTPSVVYSPDEEKIFAATRQIGKGVFWPAIIGLVALGMWTIGQASGVYNFEWAKLFGVYSLVAFAAAAAGALFGFLFGIPRSRDAAATAAALQVAGSRAARRAVLTANTNLERVSDWLTTLLLGATLVQIKPITEWVAGLGENITKPQNVTTVLVIYYLVLGFLGTYLLTRLYLTYALERMGRDEDEDEDEPTVESLSKMLADALGESDEAARDAALTAFGRQAMRAVVGNDAALNLLAARVAARRLKGTPIPTPAEQSKLQGDAAAALKKAMQDDTVKQQAQQVKAEFAGLTDADVEAALNAAPPAAVRPTIETMRQDFERALGSDDATREKALATFDQEKTRPEIARDPNLNLLVARVAARRLKGIPAPGAAQKEKLQSDAVTAVETAVTNAENKQRLQTDLRPEFDQFEEPHKSKIAAALS